MAHLNGMPQGRNSAHAIVTSVSQPISWVATSNDKGLVIDELSSLSVPRLGQSPLGPALCVNDEDFLFASERIWRCVDAVLLSGHSPSIMVDLEGELGGPHSSIATVQLSVCIPPGTFPQPWMDSLLSPGDPASFVFQVSQNPRALHVDTSRSLRRLLTDDHIVKVFHHCRGDVSAFFYDCLQLCWSKQYFHHCQLFLPLPSKKFIYIGTSKGLIS